MTTLAVQVPSAVSQTGGFTRVGGSTNHGVLGDSSDATYMSAAGNATMVMDFANAIPAGSAVRSAYFTVRCKSASGSGYLSCYQDVGGFQFEPTSYTSLTASYVTTTSTTAYGWPAKIAANTGAGADVADVKLYVTYVVAPNAPTSLAPSGAVTTTLTPTLSWTFNNADPTHTSVQKAFQVKIFTAAQAAIGGFDVNTSPHTVNVEVTSGTSSYVPPALSNGTSYVFYVRTKARGELADAAGATDYGPWSTGRTFNIAIPVPTPTALVPAAAAVSTTSRPAVGASVAAMSGGVLLKREWTIASNTGFSTNVTTIVEDTLSATKSGTYAFPALPSRLPQGTWYVRCRAVDQFGVAGSWAAYNTFTVAHAPTASSSRLPGSGQAVAYAGTRQVTWVFADPDTEDFQLKYEAELWKASAPGSPIQSGVVTNGTGAHTFTIPDTTWKGVDLRWRVRTTDQDNVAGAWSPEASFFLYDLPVAPLTFPTEAQVITTAQPTFTWTFTAAGRTQASFRVVVTRVSDSAVIADSGVTASTALSWQIPTPSILVSTNYSVTLTVVDSVGLSATSNRSFTATYSAPTTPIFSVSGTQFDELGKVFVDWSTATTDATNLGWKVYRRVTGNPLWTLVAQVDTATKTYNDYLCPSATNVQYSVVQVAESFGSPVESAYPTVDFYGESKYFLVCPDDDSLNLKLHAVTSDEFEDEQEMATQNLIGRGRRVEYGTRYGQTGSLTADFRDRYEPGGMTARQQRLALEALRSSGLKVYLKNPFGDVWAAALQSARISRTSGVGMQEITTVTIAYIEITD